MKNTKSSAQQIIDLVRASVTVREPRNLQARSDMLMASMMDAVAFQKDLGATHSCTRARFERIFGGAL